MHTALTVLSVILNAILLYPIVVAMNKLTDYEDFVAMITMRLTALLAHLREIDHRGVFEADDEVGMTFQEIATLVYTLEEFTASQEGTDGTP